eukprot:s3181_g7.t1
MLKTAAGVLNAFTFDHDEVEDGSHTSDATVISPQIKWATTGEAIIVFLPDMEKVNTILDLKKAVRNVRTDLSIFRIQLYMDKRRMQDEETVTVGGEECLTHLQCVLVPVRTPTRQESFYLHQAICKRDIRGVIAHLQQGLDPSALIQAAGGHAHNILTYALTVDCFTSVQEEHQESMKLTKVIIEAKADLNQPDAEGSTPLIFAIRSNFLQGVELLLQMSADPHQKHVEQNASPLYYAANMVSEECVCSLLKHRADPSDLCCFCKRDCGTAMDAAAAGASGSNAPPTEIVTTQLQQATSIRGLSLATSLGELTRMIGHRAASTATIDRIELHLGPAIDQLLTIDEQNILGGAIMQIYEERLMYKGEDLTLQEVREQSARVREGVYDFMNSFTPNDLVEKSRFAHLQDDEPSPMS